MEYVLKINSSRGVLQVKWSDVDKLARFANLQSGFYLEDSRSLDKDLLLSNFQSWNQYFWNQRYSQGMLDIQPGSKIIDIGSGIAVIDLLLYSFVPNCTFYLVDRMQTKLNNLGKELPSTPFLENGYPFYNDWSLVEDAIVSSDFNRDKFVLLDPSANFPENVDVITSYFSWCFHYPKKVYWEKVYRSLKSGGKLILDVRPLHGVDIIGEISEEMKCNPVKFAFPKLDPKLDSYNPVDKKISGYRCMWIK